MTPVWRVLPNGKYDGGAGCDSAPAWQPGGVGALPQPPGYPGSVSVRNLNGWNRTKADFPSPMKYTQMLSKG